MREKTSFTLQPTTTKFFGLFFICPHGEETGEHFGLRPSFGLVNDPGKPISSSVEALTFVYYTYWTQIMYSLFPW